MANLKWYWHRLRAMGPAEVGAHLRRKLHQKRDARPREWSIPLDVSADYPRLPAREKAPSELREALERETAAIESGEWKAFGSLPLRVDDPPLWHKDYLAGRDLATRESAFGLNHRSLPGGGGADVKLIWELSRWHALVRLAQASWVLGDSAAGWKCVRWLEDWEAHNPAYQGWNWTSALESGMRLIQSVWIDALLRASSGEDGYGEELRRLWQRALPPHVWFTWRYKTVGSSANNHLLGELAGLIVATARWPELATFAADLSLLQQRWEAEVLAQFATDGGNREQALNYHFYSWELCWHARTALRAAGRRVSDSVDERLRRATQFLVSVQVEEDPWDYGDSDDAFVLPLFQDEPVAEWMRWAVEPGTSPALEFWIGQPDGRWAQRPQAGMIQFEESGQIAVRTGGWFLRWDLSELGYQSTASHGHLDALHLSLWRDEVAMVIDPGTGAYYADAPLRTWLASREAHNAPAPAGVDFPKRLGPFLWGGRHAKPRVWVESERSWTGELELRGCRVRRRIIRLEAGLGWRVEDACAGPEGGGHAFDVRWQLGPGSVVEAVRDRCFRVTRNGRSMWVEVGREWGEVLLVENESEGCGYDGTVSPAFRSTAWAPCLRLSASGGEKPCLFGTTFLASAPA